MVIKALFFPKSPAFFMFAGIIRECVPGSKVLSIALITFTSSNKRPSNFNSFKTSLFISSSVKSPLDFNIGSSILK